MGIERQQTQRLRLSTEQFFLLLPALRLQSTSQRLARRSRLCWMSSLCKPTQSAPRAILELLHKLSADRPIVLFTQEPEVIQWATENLAAQRSSAFCDWTRFRWPSVTVRIEGYYSRYLDRQKSPTV